MKEFITVCFKDKGNIEHSKILSTKKGIMKHAKDWVEINGYKLEDVYFKTIQEDK